MESLRGFPAEYDLLCTENKEFLYETSDGAIPPGVNPNLVLHVDKQFLPSTKMTDEEFQNNTSRDVPTDQQATGRKRKRNSVKDKLRTEAEQNAYKKLKQIIPSLRGCKRVTKLETIRQACSYIEKLQDTLTGIRG